MTRRKTIFEIENKLNIEEEFLRICRIIDDENCSVSFENDITYRQWSFLGAINHAFFPKWPYRDTFIDVYDYLRHIGINKKMMLNGFGIDETNFLYFLEFLINISNFMKQTCSSHGIKITYDMRVQACLDNINKLLAKMHCELKTIKNEVIIVKKDIDVDSVIDIVPDNIADSLLSYCDFRVEKDLDAKKAILKDIDIYIDANKTKLDKIDGCESLRKDIDFIFNKFGINHKIDEKFKDLPKEDLLGIYDISFILVLELLRRGKINNARKTINSYKKMLADK